LKVKPGDLGNALPPLKPADVFRHLDAPMDVEEFGDRLRVDPGKVYAQQVLWAIKAFVQSGRYREPWVGKVHRLTRHGHLEVRQAALLAYTSFGHLLEPKDSPVAEFARVMDDPAETPAIREAALLAFSWLRHPRVYVRLHEVALETAHPAWSAAISRLNDLGNEFTVEHLGRVDGSRLRGRDAELLAKTHAAIRNYVEDPQRGRVVSLQFVEARLERAVWAEVTKSPLRKELTAWTKSYFVKQPDDAYVKHLEAVRDKYAPKCPVADEKVFTRLVRDLARDILTTPRRR
jgi:hypothetical protein